MESYGPHPSYLKHLFHYMGHAVQRISSLTLCPSFTGSAGSGLALFSVRVAMA